MSRNALLLGMAALLVMLTACTGGPPPAATPDPFSAVARQANDVYAEGLTLYQQGRTREALDAFERARLLSPTDDPRVDEMIQKSRADLTPTPTPMPPTPVPSVVPSPVPQSSATPSAEIGQNYFGQVFLTVAPGRDGTPVPMTEFWNQDQIGLYIERLDQRLRMAFSLRVFDLDSEKLVVDARADGLRHIQDRIVWYREGGEPVGHYRAELYVGDARIAGGDGSGAGGDTLTHVLEYSVGTTPVPIPTPPATPVPTALPQPTREPLSPPELVAPPTPRVAPAAPAAPVAPVAPAPPSAPPPAAMPAPPEATDSLTTAPPSPPPSSTAATTLRVSAGPAAFDVLDASAQLLVADHAGLVWSLEHGQPGLKQPFSVPGDPVGLAADPLSGRVYVALGSPPALVALDAGSGQQLARAPLASPPGEVRVDASLGLLYVVMPAQDAVDTFDARDLKPIRSTTDLAQVTGIVVDQENHRLYLSQLAGDVAAVDGQTGQLADRLRVTAEGLAGVAIGGGRVFAINSPGHELLELELATGAVNHFRLAWEPAALVVGTQSGAVYVLDASTNALVTLDPHDGSERSRASLGEDAADNLAALQPDSLWLRPRMVASGVEELIYVIEPRTGTLAVAPADGL